MVRWPLKHGKFEYKNKYDLKLYTIRLSKKENDIFFLELDNKLYFLVLEALGFNSFDEVFSF